ncbi:hypothetical protein C8N46_10951 [Kordia periserrulae]|uniref:Ogr/Delta-like zinc finger protein n=1 Tax=Kordia periserrulae TaxID=701523 RepID=A0A2T6BTS2_9FLAO|nr:hypothetical protein [Kordia periserrulae]PTX59463.1 hypothetical protein C8N46_10951 [Kordia periserrulae]
MKNKINCPVCEKGEIHFDLNFLVTGTSFSCSYSDCLTTIKLPKDSQHSVKSVLEGLKEISLQKKQLI